MTSTKEPTSKANPTAKESTNGQTAATMKVNSTQGYVQVKENGSTQTELSTRVNSKTTSKMVTVSRNADRVSPSKEYSSRVASMRAL